MKVMGKAIATAEKMQGYIKKKNPEVAQSVLDMIPLYLSGHWSPEMGIAKSLPERTEWLDRIGLYHANLRGRRSF